MQAIVFTQYGSPDILRLTDIAKPTPSDNQVLVKVHAASANPLDWHRMRGAPVLVRLTDGLLKPKNTQLGADIAGVVEAVGRNVTQFKPGDAVFGGCEVGGFAEYVCVSEKGLVPKPASITFEQAAAIPVAALTALQALRNKGQLRPGQTVLINGASGGVGTFAVQIAKALGAAVTGVCSTRNGELVRSIGADHVVDYTQADFRKNGQRYDLILDNVGTLSAADYQRSLSPSGVGVVVGFTTLGHMAKVVIRGAWMSRRGSQKVGSMLANINQADLSFMHELLESGQVVPVVDRCYPLSETAAAMRYLESGRARGKVVITLEPASGQAVAASRG